MGTVTITDVARAADVSAATVSRVLNNPDGVSPELRQRVIEAIDALGYRPNSSARSLRTRATRVLGVIVSDVTNPFFTSMVRGVEDVAQKSGYSVMLANTDEDLAKEQRYLEVFAAEQIAGVVLSPASATDTRIDVLSRRGIPAVTFDRRLRTAEVDRVTINNRRAAEQATEHLIEQGCRRIAFISGPPGISTSSERLAGYHAGLRRAGLPIEPGLVSDGGFRVVGGHEAALRLLAQDPRPDGMLVANNLMTVGAVNALDDLALRVPTDLALVGFDDLSWALNARSRITTVDQPTYEIGRRAAELLLGRVQGERSPARRITLPATLTVRDSSRRLPVSDGQPVR
ncbi:LacI family transcriptional regulator [Rugosimonospora africana]|uniref:LacI family transcriptional regulator n=1 Tax=Rugosimonospora africana TaxID=556532 RepID=A0A8J3VSR9_9ACTN|nr:LacI family transcriptional regulator [Rugosimonospora africana]